MTTFKFGEKNYEKLELAYHRLSMLHTETIQDNVMLRKQLDAISKCWWSALKYRIKTMLGMHYD